MSYPVSYVHAFITLIICVLCKSTCANFFDEITCEIRKLWRFYAITIKGFASFAWIYATTCCKQGRD
ncbi:hypothetical protein FOE31_20885 [Salmonella enterica]|nr:hypothetical protein [Salmonella enterica subsp. diarizonae serovar 17:z10:e,n,x,z15]ECG8814245.1 hypothetical protein [Salmonella enterica]